MLLNSNNYIQHYSCGFSCIWLLVCFRVICSHLWVEFFSLFWNVLCCLNCFTLYRYLFNLPSFASTFWYISSSCIIIFTCVAFSFRHYMSQRLPFVLSFWPVFVDFYLRFQSNFPSWFCFFLLAFWGDPNFLTN